MSALPPNHDTGGVQFNLHSIETDEPCNVMVNIAKLPCSCTCEEPFMSLGNSSFWLLGRALFTKNQRLLAP